jgi:hypothetical protein
MSAANEVPETCNLWGRRSADPEANRASDSRVMSSGGSNYEPLDCTRI